MRQILLASAAAMVMAGSAYAAEPLLEPLPPAAPAVEPFVVPSWAGGYIGGDIGWATLEIDEDDGDFFDDDNDFFNGDSRFGHDEPDGVVGGVFAGWLWQGGGGIGNLLGPNTLYGVEIFGQIADLEDDDDDFRRRFDGDGLDFFADAEGCHVRHIETGAEGSARCFLLRHELEGMGGIEAMIGWGGERAAFLLHGGGVVGVFDTRDEFEGLFRDRDTFFRNDDDDTETEFGASFAAEGRFKLTERVFAGVIGRAVWFPEIGDDDDDVFNDNGFFDDNGDDDEDLWLFEVKARLGVQFGQAPAAAPLNVGF
jgi:opacity protein-like surface antigen